MLLSPESLTLQPGLAILQGAYNTNYTVIMAGGVLASIPVLIIYVIRPEVHHRGRLPQRPERIEL